MQSVIHFPIPKRRDPPAVDWDRIESLRQNRYPSIPVEAVNIIRRIWAVENGQRERCHWHLEINCEYDVYLPDDIECAPNEPDTVWLIDLLDRFGGELICGHEYCLIDRDQIRLPLFWLNKMDPVNMLGLEQNSDCTYEHYMEKKHHWRILGKVIPHCCLLMVLIRFLNDDACSYCGFIDETTFQILLDRIEQGTSVEEAFMLKN